MEAKKMTLKELRDHVNNLSNEEFDKFKKETDLSYIDEDFDVVTLLNDSRLYDYMVYKNNGNIDVSIEF